MSSQARQAVSVSKKRKAKGKAEIKGIIRKSDDGKRILIIINEPSLTCFVHYTAIQNVWNDVSEKTPIFGY